VTSCEGPYRPSARSPVARNFVFAILRAMFTHSDAVQASHLRSGYRLRDPPIGNPTACVLMDAHLVSGKLACRQRWSPSSPGRRCVPTITRTRFSKQLCAGGGPTSSWSSTRSGASCERRQTIRETWRSHCILAEAAGGSDQLVKGRLVSCMSMSMTPTLSAGNIAQWK